jgi:Right handed beta helix region
MPQAGFVALLLLVNLGSQAATEMPKDFRVSGGTLMFQRTIGPISREEASRHQAVIQACLDKPLDTPRTFVFAPGEYCLSDPSGLRVPGDSTVVMHGARFVFAKDMQADGQAFLVENASNVTFVGGEIVGQRDAWDPGVNIAGIRVLGNVHDVTISDLRCENLSSNAVGVFGASDDAPIRDVKLRHVVGINCCNYYGDYLSGHSGPAPGSDRKDQGTVALYHVDGWLVTGCRFEKSQSDGTHFYHAHNGRFVDSVVTDSQMGGYFLEGCEQVLASGNLVQRNGSRGVTIERDSRFCTLQNNLVAFSGREGLWAPDVAGIIVAGNIFRENGQKDDGEKDCEIRLDDEDRYPTKTVDVRIEGNVFCTKACQTAAIFMGPGVEGVSPGDNTYRGEAPPLYTAPK